MTPLRPSNGVRRLGPRTRIRLARAVIDREIALLGLGSRYASGLASEGYAGGYRDALDDIVLVLNGVVPQRRNYWDAPEVLHCQVGD